MEYTTKQDFISAFEGILAPVRKTLIACEGKPVYGHTAAVYQEEAVYAEAFLRPLWGLVPYWYGGHGDEKLKEGIRRGIIAGTDPTHPHYWRVCNHYDQIFVEMAPLAFGLLLTPDVLWDPLTDAQKENLSTWLWQINKAPLPTNNWRFFRILTNVALRRLGLAHSTDLLSQDLEDIESYYLDNGWYSDGPRGQRDFYIAWAFHFYGLIYARFVDDDYAARYRARAKLFARDFLYWFSDRGEALPYGRSLTYRFAQGSFWSMCVFTGVDVCEPSMMKGILSHHLADWLSSPIYDYGGALSIGYKYQNLLMAEHYNAPGSPYWAMKFFALLGLPDDHPFWALPASPMPALEEKHLIREANMLVTRHNGESYAYVGGTIERAAFGQSAAKYLKFVYSTRHGINLKHGDAFDIEACTDSTLMFDIDGLFADRRHNLGFTIDEERLTIRWTPARGIIVTTEITPGATYHIRRHIIDSEIPCVAYDCGFAVASRGCDHCTHSAEGNTALAQNDFSLCRVTSDTGTPLIVLASPNTNLVYNKTVIPAVKYTIPAGRSEFVTRVEIV